MKKRYPLVLAALVGCVNLYSAAPATIAQEPIRVQSNEVFIPVFVFDKGRVRVLMDTQDPQHLHQAILAGNSQLVDKIVEEVVVRDLTAADFQILDDGKEQAIHSVAYERSLYWDVRDNIGHHTEYLGPGGGKWSTVEWPQNFIGDLAPPHYLLAYAPPESPAVWISRSWPWRSTRTATPALQSSRAAARHPESNAVLARNDGTLPADWEYMHGEVRL